MQFCDLFSYLITKHVSGFSFDSVLIKRFSWRLIYSSWSAWRDWNRFNCSSRKVSYWFNEIRVEGIAIYQTEVATVDKQLERCQEMSIQLMISSASVTQIYLPSRRISRGYLINRTIVGSFFIKRVTLIDITRRSMWHWKIMTLHDNERCNGQLEERQN